MVCRAFNVTGSDDVRANMPGAYYFIYTRDFPKSSDKGQAGIIHACPCGCGIHTLLFFRGRGIDGAPEWDVEGEWPTVTLSPSIGIQKMPNGGFHWHGYLRNGIFVEK